ncbi:MAG: ABC transporter substrate-binding protein, partial [Spirochaetota bacterium]
MTTARKFFPVSAALLLCAGLSCAHPAEPGIFRSYFQSDPGKLDPFYSTDVVSGKVLAALCNGLLRISPDGKIIPDLCEQYSFDGRRFSGTLKKDLRFSDGTPLSAQDVRFSLLRIRDSEKPTSPRKSNYAVIKEISVTGSRSFDITLTKLNMTFPWLLTQVNSYIISEKAIKERNEIIGSGPFFLKEWRRDDEIVLERNRFYHGKKPAAKGISFRIIPEDLTARFEFQTGTLDYFELPYLSSASFDDSRFRTDTVPELCVHYLALNTQ